MTSDSSYATVGVVAPKFVTSHFSVPVPTYRHSTSTWLPIFSFAVLNVTVLAAAFPLAMPRERHRSSGAARGAGA